MRNKYDDEEEASDMACLNFVDRRGWSMKGGQCKRLLKPKRGKAALRAEIQGQGKEVLRGRSAFSRTIGHRGSRRCCSPEWRGKYGSDYPAKRRRIKLRKIAVGDAQEASHSSHRHFLAKAIDDYMTGAEYPTIEPGEDPFSDSLHRFLYSQSDSESLWEISSSSLSTVASLPETRTGLKSTMLKEGMEIIFPTPWELAAARAETTALLYALFLKETGKSAPHQVSERQTKVVSREKRQKKQKKIKAHPFDESDLWRLHNTFVSWSGEQRIGKKAYEDEATFQTCRKDFLQRHGMRVCAGLKSCFQCAIQLEPTPLDGAIQRRFLEGIHGRLDGTWCLAFHGTSRRNLASIYKRGLLIPGVGNDLRVSHGSAHGLGIYAATASNPFLSWGFCDDRYSGGGASMLVCAVLDDSSNATDSTFCGNFSVRSQSANIKRVGDAFVVFEPTRIAPLFVASPYRPPARESPFAISTNLRKNDGPCSSIGRPRNRRGADIIRRRLIAICGRSVALCPRTKQRKKGADLLRGSGTRKT